MFVQHGSYNFSFLQNLIFNDGVSFSASGRSRNCQGSLEPEESADINNRNYKYRGLQSNQNGDPPMNQPADSFSCNVLVSLLSSFEHFISLLINIFYCYQDKLAPFIMHSDCQAM